MSRADVLAAVDELNRAVEGAENSGLLPNGTAVAVYKGLSALVRSGDAERWEGFVRMSQPCMMRAVAERKWDRLRAAVQDALGDPAGLTLPAQHTYAQ